MILNFEVFLLFLVVRKATEAQQAQIAHLQALIEEEQMKRKNQKIENIRRKHNYLPFIVELLNMLAREGQLVPLYEKAKQKAKEKASRNSKVWLSLSFVMLHCDLYIKT